MHPCSIPPPLVVPITSRERTNQQNICFTDYLGHKLFVLFMQVTKILSNKFTSPTIYIYIYIFQFLIHIPANEAILLKIPIVKSLEMLPFIYQNNVMISTRKLGKLLQVSMRLPLISYGAYTFINGLNNLQIFNH